MVLITDEYRKQQEELHKNPNYGEASVAYAPLVAEIVGQFGIEQMVDSGAGMGRLAVARQEHLVSRLGVCNYDPAVPKWSEAPPPCEFVACVDVLEHIEPDCLDDVIDDLNRCSENLLLTTIHTGPAKKVLPDGRNAHLIQEDESWWLPKFWARGFRIRGFGVAMVKNVDHGGIWVLWQSGTTQS